MASGLIPGITAINNQLIAPPGTRILFNQAAPPLGWTQEVGAAFNDCSVRTVTTAGGSTGGATNWSGWNFGNTLNVNGFTLSVAQLPAHNHVINIVDPSHSHVNSAGTNFIVAGGASVIDFTGSTLAIQQAAASVVANTTGITATSNNTGSGSTITPTYTTPQVKFSDYIIGIKA